MSARLALVSGRPRNVAADSHSVCDSTNLYLPFTLAKQLPVVLKPYCLFPLGVPSTVVGMVVGFVVGFGVVPPLLWQQV